jgi:hypothetical protein
VTAPSSLRSNPLPTQKPVSLLQANTFHVSRGYPAPQNATRPTACSFAFPLHLKATFLHLSFAPRHHNPPHKVRWKSLYRAEYLSQIPCFFSLNGHSIALNNANAIALGFLSRSDHLLSYMPANAFLFPPTTLSVPCTRQNRTIRPPLVKCLLCLVVCIK